MIPRLVADIALLPSHGRQFFLELFDSVALYYLRRKEVVHADQAEDGIASYLEEIPCALFEYLSVVSPFRIFGFEIYFQ